MDKLFEYILVKHRWFLVVPFLLPMSVLFDLYIRARNWLIFKIKTAPQRHEFKVREVQSQVRQWMIKAENDQKASKMCTARPGWQTMSFRRALYKNSMFNVKIDMCDILHVDKENKVANIIFLLLVILYKVLFCSIIFKVR